jgi:uncharacterized repeat protein (TIGR03943 family)
LSRAGQNFLMLIVGGAVLWITVGSGEVDNYVKPMLRLPLIGAAVVLIAFALAGIRRDWHHHESDDHESDHDGHGHSGGGPRSAWLLYLPVLAIFAIAPPALGVFTASRAASRPAPPPSEGDYAPLPPGSQPVRMKVGEFMNRSFDTQTGGPATLAGRQLQLTGFVTTARHGTWYLNRLQISCCAADAITLQITILGAPAPPTGTWVAVTGTWQPAGTPRGDAVFHLKADAVTPTAKPSRPYE